MATLIQSLSWTLILSVGQGVLVFSLLWLLLKAIPASPNTRYHLSLSALTILFVWFAATWWQLFHAQSAAMYHAEAMWSQQTVILQPTAQAGFSGYRWLAASAGQTLPWLSAFYFIGLAIMLVRLSGGVLHTGSFRKRNTISAGDTLNDLLTTLKVRMQLATPVRLLASAKARVPMVIGIIKPVILLPAATIAQLSTEQLETILLHELAHIKRNDYLVNILQTVAETILFFNPSVWMISRITRRERELCCDDMVLSLTSDPLDYATALAALAGDRDGGAMFALAASGHSYPLFGRIERILEMKKSTFSYSRMIAAVLICIAIVGSVAWLVPSFTKNKKQNYKKTAIVAPAPLAERRTDDRQIQPAAKKEKTPARVAIAPSPAQQTQQAEVTEENILVNRLVADGVVDVIKGFVVEKKEGKLYINNQLQTDDIATKYLPAIKKENLRVQVFSFGERQRMHPDAGFIQLLLPTTFSSPCVDYSTKKKPGC